MARLKLKKSPFLMIFQIVNVIFLLLISIMFFFGVVDTRSAEEKLRARREMLAQPGFSEAIEAVRLFQSTYPESKDEISAVNYVKGYVLIGYGKKKESELQKVTYIVSEKSFLTGSDRFDRVYSNELKLNLSNPSKYKITFKAFERNEIKVILEEVNP